jgi:hypothetical protein
MSVMPTVAPRQEQHPEQLDMVQSAALADASVDDSSGEWNADQDGCQLRRSSVGPLAKWGADPRDEPFMWCCDALPTSMTRTLDSPTTPSASTQASRQATFGPELIDRDG